MTLYTPGIRVEINNKLPLKYLKCFPLLFLVRPKHSLIQLMSLNLEGSENGWFTKLPSVTFAVCMQSIFKLLNVMISYIC